MCITPLSIEIAFSSLEDKAVTSVGEAKFEWCSGNNALGIFDLILFIISELFFSIKKTGILFFFLISFANSMKLSIGQLFFLYWFPWVNEIPI